MIVRGLVDQFWGRWERFIKCGSLKRNMKIKENSYLSKNAYES